MPTPRVEPTLPENAAGDTHVVRFGGREPAPRWRRWRAVVVAVAAVVLAGLVLHGALAGRRAPDPAPPDGLPPSPAYVPDPVLAVEAGGALPSYPGRVPPIGYLNAASGFVGTYGDTPGRPIQLDLACAGTGTVLVEAYPDRAQRPSGPRLAAATVACGARPVATTVSINAPPSGQYQVILTAGPAAGVVAWRLIPW